MMGDFFPRASAPLAGLIISAVILIQHPSGAYIFPESPEWEALETDGGAFDSLRESLSSPGILQKTSNPDESAVQSWAKECMAPFENEGYPMLDTAPAGLINGSNYELFEQPSGMCADHLSCAYVGCYWPYDSGVNGNDSSTKISTAALSGELPHQDLLNLPAYVLHAQTVGDIVALVNFCSEHDIAISVKTSGHSYLGGSTSRGSILIHMAKFPKYTNDLDTALIKCQGSESSSTDLCNLALARGVSAALRVGGGQVWDEVYRAVHEHNAIQQETSGEEYHVVGAAAGTVSAAGGWLSGGGLSGTTGMRLFGFGVDQILQMEMILSNGQHVLFGPSQWEQPTDESSSFPQTTQVQGFCNVGSTQTNDESQWDWQPCPTEVEIDFLDLWYAVRGGAAGYGIVTSAVFQLHKKPGKLQVVYNVGMPGEVKSSLPDGGVQAVTELWLNFLIDFFFDPSSLSVTEAQSNSCGSPTLALSLDPFHAGEVYCHNDAGKVMVDAWESTVINANNSLMELGIDPSVTYTMTAAFSVVREVEDVAESAAFIPTISPMLGQGVPSGRLPDYPKPGVVPSYSNSHWSAILPKSWILTKEKSIPFLFDYVTENPINAKSVYVLGGRTALDHDHMNAVTTSQRQGSLMIPSLSSAKLTERLLTEIYGDADGPEFPPAAEYNHAGSNQFGPQKNDWTKPCPMSWERTEKLGGCVSLQESVWGTTNLAKLTGIKSSVDPENLFNCFGCVLYVEVHRISESTAVASNCDGTRKKDGTVSCSDSSVSSVVSDSAVGVPLMLAALLSSALAVIFSTY